MSRPASASLVLYTQAELDAYSQALLLPPTFRDIDYIDYDAIYHQSAISVWSRVYQVTQLRTDGVHCRESACIVRVSSPQGGYFE